MMVFVLALGPATRPFFLADRTGKHQKKRQKKNRDEVDRSFLEAQARWPVLAGLVTRSAEALRSQLEACSSSNVYRLVPTPSILVDFLQAAADVASRRANQTATLDALFELLFRQVSAGLGFASACVVGAGWPCVVTAAAETLRHASSTGC